MTISILLAGDHCILREGLRSLLSRCSDIQITGETADVETTMASVRDLTPDLVLLEAEMAGEKGVQLAGRIRSEFPEVKVIAHSAPPGRRMLADLLRAGTGGYLDRASGTDDLMQAIRSVAAGRPYLGPLAADSLVEEFAQRLDASADSNHKHEQPSYIKTLTAREVEVLRLLATGKRVKEIARVLNISVKTVESHRQNMMDKLEIHNAIELARYALRQGLVSI
ncbi:MAG TPA: response regulator transcription factor [Bryobacteraceae bacterium]|nr:response regulator transcription factor [Bryobacteraceae bacterium]